MTEQQEIHRVGAQTRSLPAQLESLLSHWLLKCGGRPMPAHADFPVEDLRPWLGSLALIEIRGGQDGRVRLCGSGLIRRLGREATGVAVGDLAFDIAKQLRAIIKAVDKAAAPVVAVSPVQLGRGVTVYCEVGFPLSGERGRLATVLLGSYPVRSG